MNLSLLGERTSQYCHSTLPDVVGGGDKLWIPGQEARTSLPLTQTHLWLLQSHLSQRFANPQVLACGGVVCPPVSLSHYWAPVGASRTKELQQRNRLELVLKCPQGGAVAEAGKPHE